MKHKCPQCSETFYGRKNKIACSTECYRELLKTGKHVKKGITNSKLPVKVCKDCGESTGSNHPLTERCRPCARKAQLAKYREWYIKNVKKEKRRV